MDSYDLEFAQFAADALGMSDVEYSSLVQEFNTPEWQEEAEPEDEEQEPDWYELAGDWDDWLEADSWYELTAEYSETN